MYKNWVLVERHKLDYKEHRNQENRVIKKKTGAKPRQMDERESRVLLEEETVRNGEK
jgi:hypothetical protein